LLLWLKGKLHKIHFPWICCWRLCIIFLAGRGFAT
jgi:hypothetical protein